MATKGKINIILKAGEKQIFTREQVIELLKKQIAQCADSIQGNCSEYTAKKKVMETKIVEV